MRKLLIDLDGVLNEYNGNFDKNIIPKPRKDTDQFLKNLSDKYELILFTTRNKLLASKWLLKYNLDKYFADITNIKELSWLIIDDRCLRFDGNYETLLEKIDKFKPYYKL